MASLVGCEQAPVSFPPFGVSDDAQYLSGRPGPGLVMADQSPIPDVPFPIGFKPLPGKSRSSTRGGVRRVHHVYQGLADAADVVQFYRQHMPEDGWRLADVRQGKVADAIMHYTKGSEALRLSARAKNGVTTVIIDIGPRGMFAPSAGQAGEE